MTDMQTRARAPARLRVARLDGLRGLAVLMVVVFHAELRALGMLGRPGGGFVGVAVFFVLSGYLITNIVWRSPDGASWCGYLAFLRRRCIRLAPALTALVLIWAVISVVIGPESVGSVLASAVMAVTQTTSYYLAAGGEDQAGWGPTWSLSVEWCFYVFWPLVVLLLRRRAVTPATGSWVAIGLGLVLYVAALPLTDKQFYFLPLANVSALLWGGALALRHIRGSTDAEAGAGGRDPVFVIFGVALLLVLTVLPGNQTGIYRWFALPVAVIGALIAIDGRPGTRGWADRLLESRPLRGVGLRAYSIYLWHLPVLVLMHRALAGGSSIEIAGISLLVLVPVVWASFRFLERPWLSGRGRGTVTSAPVQVVDSPGVTNPATVVT